MTTVIHQPRVAWDGARLIAACCGGVGYPWLHRALGELTGDGPLGADVSRMLTETNYRLIDAHHRGPAAHETAATIAAGLWRTRLQELLQEHPDLTAPLARLVADAPYRP